MENQDTLTPEQMARIPDYVKKWFDVQISTGDCNFPASCEAAKAIYRNAGLKEPKYFLGPFNNPVEAAYAETLVDEYCDGSRSTESANEEIMRRTNEYFAQETPDISKLNISDQIYGSMEASWLSIYDFFEHECGVEECATLRPLMDLSKSCGWAIPLEDAVLLQHKPDVIKFDERERFHNLEGPAIGYRGSKFCNVYAVHGVIVTEDIINRNYNAKDIDEQSNAEVRRVMIELYGQEKYLQESGATVVHSDDFGTLYRKEIPDDEPIMMVKVVNSTPEPDGSYKDYWLRVDPNAYGGVKTAKAAVASTWRNEDGSMVFASPDDYDPAIET